MIYVDVTGACLLPLQSGIPRTTRGVHQLLREHCPGKTLPIFWQPFRCCYTKLSSRAQQLLDDPLANWNPSQRTPRDSTLPILGAAFRDLLGRWPQAVPLAEWMQKDDVLLLTSIFPDNRLTYLRHLETWSGFKVAIFHDAIPMRDPRVADWEKTRHRQTLKLLAHMDRVIAVSESSANDLRALWREYGISARASLTVIPWPVPFTSPRPIFSSTPWDMKKILYVSRLKKTKNHVKLFAACEKLWGDGLDFELELIGCEDEARESRTILKAVAQLREHGRPVLWRGHVTEQELHDAYKSATFTVFPSRAEGFGLPVIESFWHGRAVICSNRDAVGELARDGGCVIADVESSHALAEAMKSLLRDEAQCLTLSKEAHARPLRTWADYWQELKLVLENR